MAKIRKFTAQRLNDAGHTIMVYGVQYPEKKTTITTSTPKHVHKGKIVSQMIQHTQTIQHLDITIAIQHPDDTYNALTAMSVCQRRMKRKQYHMNFTSPQFMGDDVCQAILDTEADYIAAHTEDFIKKIRKYK